MILTLALPQQIEPISLHRENNRTLVASDVLIPAYPGSGHALLGNVLLELGLNYTDPYTELFGPAGQSRPLDVRMEYRNRLAATAMRDANGGTSSPRRFVKTHLYPADFPLSHDNVVLLVRDPRDAIHSYYCWRRNFSEEGEDGTFEEFLDRPGPNGVPPIQDWLQFHASWLGRDSAANLMVVRFEDLKRKKAATLESFLNAFAPEIDKSGIARAFSASSFAAMRAHEDKVSGQWGSQRIMRRGKVEERREWFAGGLAKRFLHSGMPGAAAAFGYTQWPSLA